MFKFLKLVPLVVFYYILLCFFLYLISGILLIKKIYPNLELINRFQKNYYLESGIRNIWQNNPNCVKFDKKLIYVPKYKNCNFKNLEFNTNISFDQFGRFSKHPLNSKFSKNSIAVLGDSFAMGWGVNDDETFSAILENKLERNVYNLAVSSYGTKRELIRLRESKLIDKINTIILVYCYNDFKENIEYKINSQEAFSTFNKITSSTSTNLWRKFRRMIRYSVQIPKDLYKQNNNLDFTHHKKILIELLEKDNLIKNKKIYVFYVNGKNLDFKNFPDKVITNARDIEFINLKLKDEHYFKIDEHLNVNGHKYIAKFLFEKIFNKT